MVDPLISVDKVFKLYEKFNAIEIPLPVVLVEFILPFQLSVLNNAVVPQDQAARDPLMHLICQVTQEQRCILHCKLLQAEHIMQNHCPLSRKSKSNLAFNNDQTSLGGSIPKQAPRL